VNVLRISKGDEGGVFPVGLEQGKIGARVGADDLGGILLAALVHHHDLGGALHHVVIGHDIAVPTDEEAGALATELARRWWLLLRTAACAIAPLQVIEEGSQGVVLRHIGKHEVAALDVLSGTSPVTCIATTAGLTVWTTSVKSKAGVPDVDNCACASAAESIAAAARAPSSVVRIGDPDEWEHCMIGASSGFFGKKSCARRAAARQVPVQGWTRIAGR
jgi:hypothetical protein